MNRIALFVLTMLWSLSASAQVATPAPEAATSGGGMLFGLLVLLAAVVIGGTVWVLLKRRKARV
jgi:hypothetical protein